jgi:hypothetical protein
MSIRVKFKLGAIVAVLLLSFNSLPALSQANVALPATLDIVAPAPSISPDIRALSGKWYGMWNNTLEHILVVEAIKGKDDITCVYGYGTAPSWHILKPGWLPFTGKFYDGGLHGTLSNGAELTYKLQPDGTMKATYERNGHVSRATLKKLN